MITGARQGKLSGLRRLFAAAMARDLTVFVIPGPDIARAHGLDIDATGLRPVASPRHASVLLVIGEIPPALREAAAVIYAQMMRPRALLVLGTETLSPLPTADIAAGLSQQGLIEGVHQLRQVFSGHAFQPDISDFDAPVLQTRIEYTCPMHPEVIQDEPGSCPKCGMTLVPREAQANMEHAHMEPKKTDTGTDTQQMASTHDHSTMNHDAPVEYTCPMHPEVVQNEPGSCPKCGMFLEPRETQNTHKHSSTDSHTDHASMDHSAMNHDEMSFMSMIDVTKDLPRSTDGLPMEWVDAPFGPFFPGLPGGLVLELTLDGDTIAGANAHALTENMNLLPHASTDSTRFVEQLADVDPLTPIAYRLLACQALENAADMHVPTDVARARAGALERERITSHLGWLTLFAQQTGFDWLMRRAGSLQLTFQHASLEQVVALKPAIRALIKRLHRTLLLKSRTVGIGRLMPDATLRGPVARAAGMSDDARSKDPTFTTLGFTPAPTGKKVMHLPACTFALTR